MSFTAKTSAPSTLALFGEHAVLHGNLAISCALDLRIHVELETTPTKDITIHSNLGTISFPISDIPSNPQFSFVLESIRRFQKVIHCGFSLKITSEFSSTVGLGSSAAVTVATLGCLYALCHNSSDAHKIFEHALKVIEKVQGYGSGLDLAASVFGGIIAYKKDPQYIEKLQPLLPITCIFSGSKMKTPEVIQKVQSLSNRHPEVTMPIFSTINSISIKARDAIIKEDMEALGQLMNIHHGLLDALGVNNKALSEIAFELRSDSNIYGSKISGSGLGDCVIGLGKALHFPLDYEQIPVSMSQSGLKVIFYENH